MQLTDNKKTHRCQQSLYNKSKEGDQEDRQEAM